MLSEIFFSLVVTSGIGLILAIVKIISKSRCDTIDCWICKIHRNVELEALESRTETKENL
jgi:hypothetical protein